VEYLVIILTALLSSIGASIGTYIASRPKAVRDKVEEDKEWKHDMNKAMQSLLRNEIQKKYTMMSVRGYAKPYEKQNVGYLYESYEKLGGNSYIKSLYEKMIDLEIIDKENENETKQQNL
jgi:hypothetical protein